MSPAHYFHAVKRVESVKRHVVLGLFKPPIILILVSHPHTSPTLSHSTVLLLLNINNPKTRPLQPCSSPGQPSAFPTVPERLYPVEVYVERTLQVWVTSRWRGAREFNNDFLALGFGHLPRGSPTMYRVEEVIYNRVVVAILAHFTNDIDVFYLLGRVFWCGCEFIAFTTQNILTNYNNIFPIVERMHTLPYPIDNTPEEQ
ncbi:Auxin-induced protein 5NG4 [Hordeum vulgare]|nr:Auxin-induced protein 5NG4 [Hordeum vulgare]